MAHRITLIPGDGIGPEVVEAARRGVEATGVAVKWDRQEMGAGMFARVGDPLPASTLASIRTNGVALKGQVETPSPAGCGACTWRSGASWTSSRASDRVVSMRACPLPTTRST